MRYVALAALAACSFVELPMPRRAQEPQRCPWGHVTLDVVAGSALTLTGVGLAVTIESGTSSLGIPTQRAVGAVALTTAGVAALLSAVHGESVASNCERDNKLLEAQRIARASSIERRERAWAITRSAADAARAGDCARVLALHVEVHEVDAEFHAAVFVRDVAIARCLSGR